MTCYLTDDTDPDELARGFEEGVWIAAKLYPAGATTNSAQASPISATSIRRSRGWRRSGWCCASTAK